MRMQPTQPQPGRRPGEVSLALLRAIERLAQGQQGPTLRELAADAGVGLDAARRALDNLRRCGRVRIARYRRVAYRNRPVAEYALPSAAPAPVADAAAFLARCWG